MVAGADAPKFYYSSHTKADKCVQDWLFMEELLNNSGMRCREVISIDGFPYLRGNKKVLELASKISTKYANHKWLELLRRIDLQARYAELSALEEKQLEKFCSKAGIDCLQGRIRAYVARCSAIIMGDEKSNHDFIKVLKQQALKSAKSPNTANNRPICFQDEETLDGIAGPDVISAIFSPPPKAGISSGFLQKRIQMQKKLKPYR